MLFNFFGVTAIWQEIPWITEASNVAETVPSIDTSSASDAVIPTVSDDVWISDELEVATIKSTEETVETEKDTFFIRRCSYTCNGMYQNANYHIYTKGFIQHKHYTR